MDYYEILFETIENAIKSEDFNKALELINDELKLPYVPKEYYQKLQEYKEKLPIDTSNKAYDDQTIEGYLKGSIEQQLIAVDALSRKNLREYLDLCNEYLCSDGFINSKVLLIDALIRQDIGEDIKYINEGIEYEFIPKYVMLPEESFGYKTALKDLNELYLKNPSMLELAKSLVYKECIMALPVNLVEEEGHDLALKIYDYVNEAFNA